MLHKRNLERKVLRTVKADPTNGDTCFRLVWEASQLDGSRRSHGRSSGNLIEDGFQPHVIEVIEVDPDRTTRDRRLTVFAEPQTPTSRYRFRPGWPVRRDTQPERWSSDRRRPSRDFSSSTGISAQRNPTSRARCSARRLVDRRTGQRDERALVFLAQGADDGGTLGHILVNRGSYHPARTRRRLPEIDPRDHSRAASEPVHGSLHGRSRNPSTGHAAQHHDLSDHPGRSAAVHRSGRHVDLLGSFDRKVSLS